MKQVTNHQSVKQIICLLLTSMLLPMSALADNGTSNYDQLKPFGFCTQSSRTTNSPYNITGGGCYEYPVTGVSSNKVITLTSTGKDMKNTISNAINNYNVIIFDGSQGDFIVASTISLNSLSLLSGDR